MNAAPDATTPTAYLAALPADRKKALTTLHRAIRKAAPKLKAGICHGMIGYGIGPYKTKSGCTGEWFKVGLASQKNYISLYICACDKDEGYLAENNKDRLGKVSVGKSCIRFKKLEQLDLDVALELVQRAAESELTV
ncbi:MAG: hypothetical protein SynsKO_10540 [Synoicihabitans sp.]